jgi:hypothetical protein
VEGAKRVVLPAGGAPAFLQEPSAPLLSPPPFLLSAHEVFFLFFQLPCNLWVGPARGAAHMRGVKGGAPPTPLPAFPSHSATAVTKTSVPSTTTLFFPHFPPPRSDPAATGGAHRASAFTTTTSPSSPPTFRRTALVHSGSSLPPQPFFMEH